MVEIAHCKHVMVLYSAKIQLIVEPTSIKTKVIVYCYFNFCIIEMSTTLCSKIITGKKYNEKGLDEMKTRCYLQTKKILQFRKKMHKINA